MRKNVSAPSAQKTLNPILSCFIVFLSITDSIAALFNTKIEHPDAEMLILNVRAEIWDFLNVRTQKWVRMKWHQNAISVLFLVHWFGEILENSSKFSKTAPSAPFRALRSQKSETPAINFPRAKFLQSNAPSQGGGGSKPHYI